jgi:glycosyltransferase involved in cell wall biosynthesis
MRILLIGPYPPPHGGVSVHVSGIDRQLTAAGVECQILNTNRIGLGLRFGIALLRYALQGWTLHLHTNGHNWKSWLLALGCGLAGQSSGGCVLTLHSGMSPAYLGTASVWRRRLAGLTCLLYSRIICVSPGIRNGVVSLGVPRQRTEIVPACLKTERPQITLEPLLEAWIGRHRPLFSTALFFRPEYGFDLLVAGLARLRVRYPSFGCLVMGSGGQRAEAERRIHELGLEENVLIVGDVVHDVCLTLISISHVFIRATLEDGDSISVREALALGVPVVASRVGMRPDGVILFPPGDVDEMVSKIELALAVERGADAHVAGCMDRLMDIYRKVAA